MWNDRHNVAYNETQNMLPTLPYSHSDGYEIGVGICGHKLPSIKDIHLIPPIKTQSSLTNSKERIRDLGEVFTPDFLVDRMLDNLPYDAWSKRKQWLEPTCGNGQFILGILRHKLKRGFGIVDAVATTFGMDIMQDNVDACHHRIYTEIVLPYFASNAFYANPKNGEPRRKSTRWAVIVHVENNIVRTKNSLDEDWNGMFVQFADLPEAEKDAKILVVQKALEMVDGLEKPDTENALYMKLLRSFGGK
jgi:hypothetical protein